MSKKRRYTENEVQSAMDFKVQFMGCAEDDLPTLMVIAALQEEVEILRQAVQRESAESTDFFIGQRVMLNNSEVGTIVAAPKGQPARFGVWVHSPSKGYASDYALHNVKPLPGGQL